MLNLYNFFTNLLKMPLVGAYILPHGALALNPYKYPQYSELISIYKACNQLGDEIYLMNPDIIFFITPHGISLINSFALYFNSKASGNSEWENNWKEYQAEVEICEDETKGLFKALYGKEKYSIEGIISYAETELIQLRWGEVIPLWFLQQPYKNNTISPLKFPQCIIMSIPRKRVEEAQKMIDESLEIGKDISKYFSESKKNIVVIVSGDLAHTHSVVNKFSDDQADLFDKLIEKWANDPLKNENNLIDCAKLVNKYLSCGFIGFLILHGIFVELSKSLYIQGNVLCNYHPTYYGMMVVSFERA